MKASDYADEITWHVRSVVQDADTGEDLEDFTAQAGKLWAKREITSGTRDQDGVRMRTGSDGTLTVRCEVAISPGDRVVTTERNETFVVETVFHNDFETVLEVHSYDV